jgi:hypothetical protein
MTLTTTPGLLPHGARPFFLHEKINAFKNTKDKIKRELNCHER